MILKIISAEEILFEGKVTLVNLPGSMGEFTVLPNHASLISTLTAGTIRYDEAEGSERREMPVAGGIVDVDNNVVSVCIY